jgi:hypothetical protein
MSWLNVVFDIDGTLISEDNTTTIGPYGVRTTKPHKRPYLKQLLYFCFTRCQSVSLWTNADKSWCLTVYNKIFNPIIRSLINDTRLIIQPYFSSTPTAHNLTNIIIDYLGFNFTMVYHSDMDVSEEYSTACCTEIFQRKPLHKMYSDVKSRGLLDKNNTLIIDNIKENLSCNELNGIHIPTYHKGTNDKHLLGLIEKLTHIINNHNTIPMESK